MLQLKNETTGHVALEISGGGALIGIDGASDSVHILAICGNPIIKSNGFAYDKTVISSAANPATGSIVTDGAGNGTITTNTGQAAVLASGGGVTALNTNSIGIRSGSNTTIRYCYF